MLPFRKASVLQIWELWGNFSRNPECTITLTCPDQSHPRAPLTHAQHRSWASAQVLAPALAWAGLQVSLSRALTLCYRRQLPSLTSDVPRQEELARLSQGSCCWPWLLSADLLHSSALGPVGAQAWPVFYPWLLFLCNAPCPCCSPTASPGKDPSRDGAPRSMGGRYVAGVPGRAGLGN